LWIARPLEKPGAVPLEFEDDVDPAIELRGWPMEHVVKCLVQYHPADPAEMRTAQEERVGALFRACGATGHELLLEVIPPREKGDQGAAVAESMQRFYALGVRPDWWKLPPLIESAAWTATGDVIRRHDPHCRGIVILGQDSGAGDLARAFAAATAEPLVRGFAVGRHIFWDAAEAWFAGKVDDETVIATVARNYRAVAQSWAQRGQAVRARTA
jgi:5-dehydro-2-deoxygluconokinase